MDREDDRITLDYEENAAERWAVIFRFGDWGDPNCIVGDVGFLVELWRSDGKGFTFFARALSGRGDASFHAAAEMFERLSGRATTCALVPAGARQVEREGLPAPVAMRAPFLRLVGPDAGGPGGVA